MDLSKQKQMDKTFFEELVSRMVIDDVSMAIKNDKHGELEIWKTYTNLSKEISKIWTVRSDLSLLGRVVLAMRT